MIELVGVSRSFGPRRVLHRIDLEVPAGEHLTLQGPNGCGKTTLLHIACGLLRPTAGTARINGAPPTRSDVRRNMGVVLQDAPVYRELTTAEHVRWWSRLHGADTDVASLLEDAGLAHTASRSAATLSRGQRQRLALCMAFATEPRILILDEPTTGLDDDGRRWLRQRLADTEATILSASHEDLGAKAVTLEAGRIGGGP